MLEIVLRGVKVTVESPALAPNEKLVPLTRIPGSTVKSFDHTADESWLRGIHCQILFSCSWRKKMRFIDSIEVARRQFSTNSGPFVF
jgi:hypothetical protein